MKRIKITESQLRMIMEREDIFVSPQSDEMEQQFDNVLSQAGITLSDEEKMELSPECPIEEPPSEYAEIVNKIKSNLDKMDVNGLVKVLKQVTSVKDKNLKEQVGGAILIAGISVPAVAVAAVAGLIAIIIIVKLAKLIFRKGRKSGPSCKRRRKLISRFGVEGYFR